MLKKKANVGEYCIPQSSAFADLVDKNQPAKLADSRPKYQPIMICDDVPVVVDIMRTKTFWKFTMVHMIILNLMTLWTTIPILHLSRITCFDTSPLATKVDLANSSAIDVCPS
ncbi:hypothetical protein EDD85DRAFT_956802 [Armillaria nabsnona]|nr:hypothetical protein EDD85DRAFT_956802 [Armillaria nabsnona]